MAPVAIEKTSRVRRDLFTSALLPLSPNGGERCQEPFAGTDLRVLRTNGS